jgi:ATP/ADP translocase
MFIAIALVMAGVIFIYKKLTSGQDQVFIITISESLFSLSLFLLQSNLTGLFIPLLYIWMEVVTVLSIFQFWILAGEIFNARQTKRIFTMVGAGGSFAGMCLHRSPRSLKRSVVKITMRSLRKVTMAIPCLSSFPGKWM